MASDVVDLARHDPISVPVWRRPPSAAGGRGARRYTGVPPHRTRSLRFARDDDATIPTIETQRSEPWIVPLLVVATAIRIAVNDVVAFSHADETVYLLYAKALAAGDSYRHIIATFIGDRGMWVLPNPLRWAYIGTNAFACALAGGGTHHTLATVSTLAGIAVVALTWIVTRELFPPLAAAIATALAATSPLQLALGRRALSDEFFCAAVLASLATLLLYLRTRHVAWLAAWVAATTIAFATKEQFLLVYPFLLLFWWMRKRELRWEWLLPPFLFFAVFCLLARDVTSFFRVGRIITGEIGAPYAIAFQSGPPQRLLIDWMAVAPLVMLAFVAVAIVVALRWSAQSPELRAITMLTAAVFVVHALMPSQNLRYVVEADAFARIAVAAFLAGELRERPRALVAALAVNAAAELALFHRVFIAAAVYDPVTHDLFRALRMIP